MPIVLSFFQIPLSCLARKKVFFIALHAIFVSTFEKHDDASRRVGRKKEGKKMASQLFYCLKVNEKGNALKRNKTRFLATTKHNRCLFKFAHANFLQIKVETKSGLVCKKNC